MLPHISPGHSGDFDMVLSIHKASRTRVLSNENTNHCHPEVSPSYVYCTTMCHIKISNYFCLSNAFFVGLFARAVKQGFFPLRGCYMSQMSDILLIKDLCEIIKKTGYPGNSVRLDTVDSSDKEMQEKHFP